MGLQGPGGQGVGLQGPEGKGVGLQGPRGLRVGLQGPMVSTGRFDGSSNDLEGIHAYIQVIRFFAQMGGRDNQRWYKRSSQT